MIYIEDRLVCFILLRSVGAKLVQRPMLYDGVVPTFVQQLLPEDNLCKRLPPPCAPIVSNIHPFRTTAVLRRTPVVANPGSIRVRVSGQLIVKVWEPGRHGTFKAGSRRARV